MNKIGLRKLMKNSPQTNTMSIYEHGVSVAKYYLDLYNHVVNGTTLKLEWKLPFWQIDKKLWERAFDPKTMINYLIYHDCGKPMCMEIDSDGRRHFKNHAAVSKQVWIDAGGDDKIAQLIGMDMDLHLMKSGQEECFALRKEACSLIISALCEIHSNAEMFGGIDSTSFKIKHKHLTKFGKRVLDLLPQ